MPYLVVLDLAPNNLSGRIPNTTTGGVRNFIENKCMLQILELRGNNFIGEVPRSLMNCSSLGVLSLGHNRLSGKIPTWIGTSLPSLAILDLSANLFTDSMPLSLCNLQYLYFLDLSENSITGTIPQCLDNMLVKKRLDAYETAAIPPVINYNITFYTGDRLVAFQEETLPYYLRSQFVVLDLSSNRLEGNIPEITDLSGLIYLNLSRNTLIGIIPQTMNNLQEVSILDLSMNNLSGKIPPYLGSLPYLEVLDLSYNNLSGKIPPYLDNLPYLEVLNLSYNNLSGKIPIGGQFDTLDKYSYEGNPNLCGSPLPRECQQNGKIQDYASFYGHLLFYSSIALGFITGFWGICGISILKSSWRHAYFQFVDKIWDKLYETIAISKVKLSRNFQTRC